ncbi:uncharacterized protein C7orf43 homolog isoform X2 [Acanthaster planci]|uniref:Uncharacterized protein C7orf43 homolog isoform X2 n=1 Tax=Acanthaster planci TaxID=133434 RepID=A0A8B7YZ61_ACAPL|nr:uncharacterized protein C7orf43 homolog isoform X2 [Acanthaster planci]
MADDLDVLQKDCKFELIFPSKEPTNWLDVHHISPRCKIYSGERSDPIVHNDIVIFPLSASLNTLPSSLRTLTVSVHLTSQAASRKYPRENNYRYFDFLMQLPMEDVFQLQRPLLKCTVKAELAVLPPPEVRFQHVAVAGKHFLIIKVSNDYAERLIIDQVDVLWNKNHSLQHASHPAWLHKTDQASENDVVDEMDSTFIELVPSPTYHTPSSLQPLEQHAFVFQLHFSQFWRSTPAKGIELPLLLSITWLVQSMVDKQTVCTHYSLPSLRLDFPSFIMSALCPSPIQVGNSFNMNYTLLNNLQDFLGITLLWMPGNRSMTDTDETSSRFIEEAIVCEQPKMDLGVCHKGSTTNVSVAFQALRSGVHEVGKFMKLKLQYATPPSQQQQTTAPPSPSKLPPATVETPTEESQTNTFPRRGDRRRFKRPILPRQHSFSSLYQRFQISGNRSRSNSFTSDDETHSLPGDLSERGDIASCSSVSGSASVTNSPIKMQNVPSNQQPPKPSISIDKIAKRRSKVYVI